MAALWAVAAAAVAAVASGQNLDFGQVDAYTNDLALSGETNPVSSAPTPFGDLFVTFAGGTQAGLILSQSNLGVIGSHTIGEVALVSFNPNNNLVYAAMPVAASPGIRVLQFSDATTIAALGTLPTASCNPYQPAVQRTGNNRLFFPCGSVGSICQFDPDLTDPFCVASASDEVYGVSISPDDAFLVAYFPTDQTLRKYSIDDGAGVFALALSIDVATESGNALTSSPLNFLRVALRSDGTVVGGDHDNDRLYIFDAAFTTVATDLDAVTEYGCTGPTVVATSADGLGDILVACDNAVSDTYVALQNDFVRFDSITAATLTVSFELGTGTEAPGAPLIGSGNTLLMASATTDIALFATAFVETETPTQSGTNSVSQSPESQSQSQSQTQSPESQSQTQSPESQSQSQSHESQSQSQSPESQSQSQSPESQSQSQSPESQSQSQSPESQSQSQSPESQSQSQSPESQSQSQSPDGQSHSQSQSQTKSPESQSQSHSQTQTQSPESQSQSQSPQSQSQSRSQSQSPESQSPSQTDVVGLSGDPVIVDVSGHRFVAGREPNREYFLYESANGSDRVEMRTGLSRGAEHGYFISEIRFSRAGCGTMVLRASLGDHTMDFEAPDCFQTLILHGDDALIAYSMASGTVVTVRPHALGEWIPGFLNVLFMGMTPEFRDGCKGMLCTEGHEDLVL